MHSAPIMTSYASSLAPAPGRRRQQRAHWEVEVNFESESNFYTGFSENISAGGIFIATYNLLEVGSLVQLSLTLPGGAVVEVEGRVQWVRDPRDLTTSSVPPGIGVQFQNLDAVAQVLVESFVAQQQPLFFEE